MRHLLDVNVLLVTDMYLADLAAKHGARLATFDQGIVHPAVDLVS